MQIQIAGHADSSAPYCIILLSISWNLDLLKLFDNKGMKPDPDKHYSVFKIAEIGNFWEEWE